MREDVAREMESHIAFRAEELERQGWRPAEARAEAERRFGDRAELAARARSEAGITRRRKDRASMLEALWRDARTGARSLAKSPGFTAIAILTLALGIGANTAVFTVVSAVVLKQPPYPEPESLVVLWEQAEDGRDMPVSRPNFEDWRRAARSFETLATLPNGASQVTVFGGGEPVRAQVDPVGADFFETMGVAPERGRVFGPAESHPGEAPVVVVSHGFWRDVLGSPGDLSGETLRVGGITADVIGVMPPEFDYPYGADVWFAGDQIEDTSTRTAHNYGVIGRLAEGATLARAREEMSALAARLFDEHGPDQNDAADVVVRPLRQERAGDTGRTLLLLLGGAGFVLLIACANLATALLARGTVRVREAAVRSALGAGSGRIVRQLATENLVLAGAGGVAGILLGWAVLGAILRSNPNALPVGSTISLDPLVLGFTLAVTVLTALLFGLGPSVRLARTPPAALLRSGDRGSSRAARGTWSGLIAAEVALALVLLVGSGLFVRSFQDLIQVDPGFDTGDVLTARVSLPAEVYPEEPDVARALAELSAAVASIPGVAAVGGATQLPLATSGMDGAMEVEGRPEYGYSEYRIVMPGYFESLDIGVVEGRVFSDGDAIASPPVAVVNRALAQKYWPGESPVGRRIRGTTNDRYIEEWLTVVGVVEDIRHSSVLVAPQGELYVSALQRPNRASFMTLTIEATVDPATLAGPAREAIRATAPLVPADMETFESIAAKDVADRRFAVVLITGFALIAVLLSAIGIYGVVAYTVGRRTREIGIRVALGAERRAVVGRLVREMLGPVAAGAVIGLIAAAALSRVLRGFLFGVDPFDPLTFAAGIVILVLVAALAAWLPARRSASIDPIRALAAE